MKVSAVIITYNEEHNIRPAIESVLWADEVIVVDSESTDRTREIAEECQAKVFINEWPGFSKQKQFAAEKAANDWIFSLDADERASDKLVNEITEMLAAGLRFDGYRVPRLTTYMGRKIRHSGWYPDRQLRFFDRRKASWNDRLIHESIRMTEGSKVGDLEHDLLHFSIESARHHHKMIGERYSPLGARHMFEEGLRSSFVKTAVAGPAAFIRSYLFKLGILDGFPGFCIAVFAAHHSFLKYLMLWEMQNESKDKR